MQNDYDERNHQSKVFSIIAFFDNLDKKIDFVLELSNAGHRVEAALLCSCYIDGLALALFWPDERSNFCFVRALKEYGGERIFLYIHPKMFEEVLTVMDRKWINTVLPKILPVLQKARGRLYDEPEMIKLLSTELTRDELEKLKNETWRGTLAAIAYSRVRVPSVHGFGAPNGISFDNTTFQGEPVPAIEFPILQNCLKRIATVAREKSIKTGKWFGHDYRKRDQG